MLDESCKQHNESTADAIAVVTKSSKGAKSILLHSICSFLALSYLLHVVIAKRAMLHVVIAKRTKCPQGERFREKKTMFWFEFTGYTNDFAIPNLARTTSSSAVDIAFRYEFRISCGN